MPKLYGYRLAIAFAIEHGDGRFIAQLLRDGDEFRPGDRELLADYLEGKLVRGRRRPRHVFPFEGWPTAVESAAFAVWQDMRALHEEGELKRGALKSLLEAAADRTGLAVDSIRKAYQELPNPKTAVFDEEGTLITDN